MMSAFAPLHCLRLMRWASAFALVALLLASAVSAPAAAAQPVLADFPPMDEAPAPGASPAARELARQLNGGINFGNMLDAPVEGAWGLRVDERFISLVGEGGFTRAVRLPVRWSSHASPDASAIIDPAFFARVDSIIDRLLARGVTVVLNMHHYRQLDGDPLDKGERAVDPSVVKPRFLAMWKQIAERYAGRDPRLLFEPYNEPHGALEPDWNDLLSRAVRLIRQSNPQRVLVVGPTHWNNALHLSRLRLPHDPHLIVTIHSYEPFEFTHQGAAWIEPRRPLGTGCCSERQRRKFEEALDLAQQFGQRRGYPILVGEFGAYGRAAPADRRRYLQLMRTGMESRGMSWMYWELAGGFGVYDPQRKRFRPEVQEPLYER